MENKMYVLIYSNDIADCNPECELICASKNLKALSERLKGEYCKILSDHPNTRWDRDYTCDPFSFEHPIYASVGWEDLREHEFHYLSIEEVDLL